MRINNNITAVNSHRQLSINTSRQAKTTEKLSSGLRVNRAADDAAGLAISEKMRTQIRGLNRASLNIQDGISLLQTAEGGMQGITNILQRKRELIIQALNDTNEELDRNAIQLELEQMRQEVDAMAHQTEFNGRKLLNGGFDPDGRIDSSWLIPDLNRIVGPSGSVGIVVYSDVPGGTDRVFGYFDLSLPYGYSANMRFEHWAGSSSGSGFRLVAPNGEEFSIMAGDPDTNFHVPGLGHVIKNSSEPGWNPFIYFRFGLSAELSPIGSHVHEPIDPSFLGRWYMISDNNRDPDVLHMQGVRILGSAGPMQGYWDEAVYDVVLFEFGSIHPDFWGGPGIWIQSGANQGDGMWIGFHDMRAVALGIDEILAQPRELANASLVAIDNAINRVSMSRATVGAQQNRLEFTKANVDNTSENLSAAESRIRDADMAKEMMNFVKDQILTQSSIAMLAQSNALPQSVLQLLS